MRKQCFIFKWLLVASILWIVILVGFYYSLDPQNIEDIETLRSELNVREKRNKPIFKANVATPPQKYLTKLGLSNPGENGMPVVLTNVSDEIDKLIKLGWERHQFNEFVSDLVSVQRQLTDPRDKYCKQKDLYLKSLPATTIIIIFFNEAWSTLLRTVHSVLDRSPEHLIREIILVDDFSDMGE